MLSDIVQSHLNFIIFIVALIAERFFPLASWYHPSTVLTITFKAIGNKVYKSKDPKNYQFLAAILASSLIISITLMILVLLLKFAFYPELLTGLILYLCLESKSIDRKALRIAKLVKQNQKSAARELLQPLVAREVTKLSTPGIIKALIETLILRTARYYFVVIFIFIVLGPIATLAYRLLTLIQQSWRSEAPPNSAFLKPLKATLFFIEFVPMRLLTFTVALSNASKQSLHYIKHYGRYFYQTNTGWLLSAFSASLGVQLGGPAVYFGERFNKMRIGNERLPMPDDLPTIINRLNLVRIFWLLIIVAVEALKVI